MISTVVSSIVINVYFSIEILQHESYAIIGKSITIIQLSPGFGMILF